MARRIPWRHSCWAALAASLLLVACQAGPPGFSRHSGLPTPTGPGLTLLAPEATLPTGSQGGRETCAAAEGLHELPHPSVGKVLVSPRNPQSIFAATRPSPLPDREDPSGLPEGAGLYLSTDGGATWSPRGCGLPRGYVYGLTIAPTNSQILYAIVRSGMDGGGLFVSQDGAATWSLAFQPPARTRYLYGAIIDPRDSQTVYVYGGGYLPYDNLDRPRDPSKGLGIWKSQDGGKTWGDVSQGFVDRYVGQVVLDPRDGRVVYAVVWDGQVHKSADGGVQWQELPNVPRSSLGGRLVAHPGRPDTIIYMDRRSGLFRSSDGGLSWQSLAARGLPRDAYPGIYRFLTPILIEGGEPPQWYVAILVKGDSSALFVSRDEGENWEPFLDLPDRWVESLAVSAERGSLYVATNQGLIIAREPRLIHR